MSAPSSSAVRTTGSRYELFEDVLMIGKPFFFFFGKEERGLSPSLLCSILTIFGRAAYVSSFFLFSFLLFFQNGNTLFFFPIRLFIYLIASYVYRILIIISITVEPFNDIIIITKSRSKV